MASTSKKVKLSESEDKEENIFERFSKSAVHEQLEIAFEKLSKTAAGALGSFTINECNAKHGIGGHGKPFSKAYVEVLPNTDSHDTTFVFGTIFLKGYKILRDYLKDPKMIPKEEYMDLILSKLLEYLLSKGIGGHGKPFSKAYVEVTPNTDSHDTAFVFGTIFLKGYKILRDYLKDPKMIPKEEYMDLILSKLLEYLLSKEKEEFFRNLSEDVNGECDLAVRFAEHFFSKLSIVSSYQLDTYYPGKTNKCCCCSVNVKSHYGDTSIGNVKVWHGCLDILLGSSPVAVTVKPSSPGGKAGAEVKNERFGYLEHPDFKSQLLAQTIVFSFTQKVKHPEYNNFLIPSIGVSRESIVFFFYDCEQDILLRSMEIPFYVPKSRVVNLQAVLAAWFVVNYEFLGTGCTEEIKATKKSQLFCTCRSFAASISE